MKQAKVRIPHFSLATAMVVALSVGHPCLAQSGGCGNLVRVSKGRCSGCCCRQVWDRYDPRPELNPPDDIASLPAIEQRRFVKIFRLVPEAVKVKASPSQNYSDRIKFMLSPQYVTITNNLVKKLSRSGRMLAQEPAISAADVIKMCNDTLIYGRSLIMGNMAEWSFLELAEEYKFKNAAKMVEMIEDKRNFNRKTIKSYPMDDPECRAFAGLASKANPSKWKAFLERNSVLIARNANGAALDVSKKQVYDIYDKQTSRPLPDDYSSLPNRERLRIGKMYDLLPVQVIANSGKEFRQRAAYVASPQYAKVKEDLAARLSKDNRRLLADPAVTVAEVLKLSDEVARFGRPLMAGDMRNVSLRELATRHGYARVEQFVRRVEDSQYVRGGKRLDWPADPEFRDFELLAKAMYKDRWQDFQSRLRSRK